MPAINSQPLRASIAELEAFLAVAENSSFRTAAERLGISQPSVSNRLNKLEASVGIRLIHRTTRRVELTEAGERLRAQARQAVDSISDLFVAFREEAALKRGVVRVLVSPSLAAVLMPPVLAKFQRRHPGVRVVLREENRRTAAEQLTAGKYDFALVGGTLQQEGIRFEKLYEDHFMIVAARGHPLMRKSHPRLRDLADHPILALSNSALWDSLADAFDAAGQAYRVAIECGSLLTLLALLEQSAGVTVLPGRMLDRVDLNRVAVRPASDELPSRCVGLAMRRGRALSPAARAMVRLLEAAIAVRAAKGQLASTGQ